MTDCSPLLLERIGQVALVTMNRPNVHNAMNPQMICRLADMWEALNNDQEVKAIVITGAGDASFCSGGDLATALPLLTGAREAENEWDQRVLNDRDIAVRATLKGLQMRKPIIAAINGSCLAAGMELAIGTHIRIASPKAVFGLPEVKHGLIPFGGSVARLPRQVPHAIAMEMLLSGETISADRALRYGLVNHVLPPEEVLHCALGLAQKIASCGPVAMREILNIVDTSNGMELEDAFAVETRGMNAVMATSDAREGPAAFIEKRKPEFVGR